MKKIILILSVILLAAITISCKKDYKSNNSDPLSGRIWQLKSNSTYAILDLSRTDGKYAWSTVATSEIDLSKTYLFSGAWEIYDYSIKEIDGAWCFIVDDYIYKFTKTSDNGGILQDEFETLTLTELKECKIANSPNVLKISYTPGNSRFLPALTNDSGLAKLKADNITSADVVLITGKGEAADYEGKNVTGKFVALRTNDQTLTLSEKQSVARTQGAAGLIVVILDGNLYTKEQMDSLPDGSTLPTLIVAHPFEDEYKYFFEIATTVNISEYE